MPYSMWNRHETTPVTYTHTHTLNSILTCYVIRDYLWFKKSFVPWNISSLDSMQSQTSLHLTHHSLPSLHPFLFYHHLPWRSKPSFYFLNPSTLGIRLINHSLLNVRHPFFPAKVHLLPKTDVQDIFLEKFQPTLCCRKWILHLITDSPMVLK